MPARTVRKKTEIKRSDLSRAAATCFAARGFEAATIRVIAEEAGILVGSVYYHFATKEELLHELMRPFMESGLAEAKKQASSSSDPVIALANLISGSFAQMLGHREEHQILIGNREVFRSNPAFAYVRAAWEAIREEWRRVFREGSAQGVFSPALDADVATELVTRMINSAAGWFDPKSGMSTEDFIRFVSNFVTSGLRETALDESASRKRKKK
jgi:TetR/AcrR family transcriptional regulator, cholesterol catabolism regulator